jgi:hypothetical protein
MGEFRVLEVRLGKFRTVELCIGEVRVGEACVMDLPASQVRAGEVHADQSGFVEIDWLAIVCTVTPPDYGDGCLHVGARHLM